MSEKENPDRIAMIQQMASEGVALEDIANKLGMRGAKQLASLSRKALRKELIKSLEESGFAITHLAMALITGLNSANEKERANCRDQLCKLLGVYAPQELDVATNSFASMGYDELRMAMVTALEETGALPEGSATATRHLLANQVQVGGLVIDQETVREIQDDGSAAPVD